MKQRIYGIDLLKVMACIGVVSLHTVNGSLGMVNRIVTLVCSLSIPIFFMCSGYVAFLKENISYKYVAKKNNQDTCCLLFLGNDTRHCIFSILS